MSTLQHINSAVNHFWPEMSRRYPGFEKPQIVPAATLRGLAPTYLKSAIDSDPDSYFMFIAGDVTKGDCRRETACRFFDELFYEKLRMPSSYDVEAGGEFSRPEAIDREVLPPAGDRQFQEYYDEQMAKAGAEAADADDEFERKHGFRRDDPSIIDVTEPAASASTTAVGAASSTAVGMPKKIFFCVDFHCGSSSMLGYDPSNRLGRRDPRASRGYLREGDGVRYATDRLVKLCEAGELKWETVCREALQRMSEDDVREMAEQLDWFEMDEGEMNEKHVEGIDNVIDALDKVQRTNEEDEFDPQNLDKEIAEAGKAADEIDSKETDPLDESVSADVGEWNRILGSIR